MEEVDVPIVAGARYEDIDSESVRVKSVWVDEDLTTQIQIFYENRSPKRIQHRTVSLEDFISRIESTELTRCNTDHEAWEWRQE